MISRTHCRNLTYYFLSCKLLPGWNIVNIRFMRPNALDRGVGRRRTTNRRSRYLFFVTPFESFATDSKGLKKNWLPEKPVQPLQKEERENHKRRRRRRRRRLHAESIPKWQTHQQFQAEIEAISHACQYILANLKELNINYIKILSDSQAAIKALNKPRITSQSVLTTLEYMETLALEVKLLTLAWIKAHVGTEGNEQAMKQLKKEQQEDHPNTDVLANSQKQN